MRKYVRLFECSARDQLRYLPGFIVRNVFFAVILFTFWCLWRVVFAGRGSLSGYTLVQTLWYLAFTETIELSKSRGILQVQDEVKDGTLAVALLRPCSYPGFQLCRGMAESLVKVLPVLAVGVGLSLLMVGPLPGLLIALPFGLLLIALGLLVTNLWILAIELLSFWSEEVTPYLWIVQKLVFVLGGLFLPIDMFPDWLARVARLLPFAFSAYWPASVMVDFSVARFLAALGGALVYVAALSALVALLFGLGRRRVQAQGG